MNREATGENSVHKGDYPPGPSVSQPEPPDNETADDASDDLEVDAAEVASAGHSSDITFPAGDGGAKDPA